MALTVDVYANGIGPLVEFSTMELNWGIIPVLQHVPMSLTVFNRSLIDANISCKLMDAASAFEIDSVVEEIKAGGSALISLLARLNDAVKFRDVLQVSIPSTGTFAVKLVATGQGSTLEFLPDLSEMNFDTQFCNQFCAKSFSVVNKGRRPQTLVWTGETMAHSSLGALAAVKNQPAGFNSTQTLNSNRKMRPITATTLAIPENVFLVEPSRCSIKPGAEQHFTLTGTCDQPKVIEELLTCHGTIEKAGRVSAVGSRKLLHSYVCRAAFVRPILNIRPSHLDFVSTNLTDSDLHTHQQSITFRNDTALPISFSVKFPEQFTFTLERADDANPIFPFELEANQSQQFEVIFNPAVFESRVSRTDSLRFQINYVKQSGQREFVDVTTRVVFPNVSLSTHQIDFGTVANWMEKRMAVVVTNTGSVDVDYFWTLHRDDIDGCADATEIGATLEMAKLELKDVEEEDRLIPIQQQFDFFPTRGYLKPGESESVDVIFRAQSHASHRLMAACHVVGGPRADVTLVAASAAIEYHLSTSTVNLGSDVLCQSIVESALTISNVGHVSFDFVVALDAKNIRAKSVSSGMVGGSEYSRLMLLLPGSSEVAAGCRQALKILCCPCVPGPFEMFFTVQVAFLPAERICVRGVAVAQFLLLSLPRIPVEAPSAPIDPSTTKELDAEHESENATQPQQVAFAVNQLSRHLKEIVAKAQIRLSDSGPTLAPTNSSGSTLLWSRVSKNTPVGPSAINRKLPMQTTASTANHSPGAFSSTAASMDAPLYLLDLSEAISTEYLCDFHYVIRSTSCRVTLSPQLILASTTTATSTSSTPVNISVHIETQAGTFTGSQSGSSPSSCFKVEPDRIRNWTGATTENFTISIHPHSDQPLGLVQSRLVLVLANGGAKVVVHLRAIICVPELTLTMAPTPTSDGAGLVASASPFHFGQVSCLHFAFLTP